MQANTSQINNLVIDKLALHYKCRWDKDTHPQEYAALVNAIVEDAPEIISPLTKVRPVTLPNAYHAENGHVLRLLMWHDKKIDDLALLVSDNQSLDWWPLVENILPSAGDVKISLRMEKTEILPRLGDIGGIPGGHVKP
jgi:hypothetical protein